MVTQHTSLFRTCWVFVLNLSTHLFLDFELYNTEETKGNWQEDDEVYYEEPDLSGEIEGIDYIIEYGVNSEDIDEEA
jgi:hypothetical protein